MRILAIDIGGTKVRAGIVRDVGVTDVRHIPTLAHLGGESLLARVLAFARTYGVVDGVAIASAGVISNGVVIAATDTIPGWVGTDLGGAFDCPTTVLGDVHAHGLGEARLGAGRGHQSSLVVAIGTGIGGAMIEQGRLHMGAESVAGHIGHIDYHGREAPRCSCGRSGHIEAIASGLAVTTAYERATSVRCGGAEIDERAEAGEKAAVTIVTEAGTALGRGLGSAANLLNPSTIILSGSMTKSGATWWQAVGSGFRASAMSVVEKTPIIRGTLGDEAPLLGAAIFHQEYR